MTLDEAHLRLLDHEGKRVHVGIMLPGGVPWAGTFGVLRHQAQRLMDSDRERDVVEGVIQLKDWSGDFMVGEFVLPLDAERVVAARPKQDGQPGIDFTVGTNGEPALTVRVTFPEEEEEA